MLDGVKMSRVSVWNFCLALLADEELVEDVSLSLRLTMCEVGLNDMLGGSSKQRFNGNEGNDRLRSTVLLSCD